MRAQHYDFIFLRAAGNFANQVVRFSIFRRSRLKVDLHFNLGLRVEQARDAVVLLRSNDEDGRRGGFLGSAPSEKVSASRAR